MSEIDFAGMRETLVYFLGEKIAFKLCGPKGVQIHVFNDPDSYYDACDYDGIEDIGELVDGIRITFAKIRPGRTYKQLSGKRLESIMLGAMLKHGVSPNQTLGNYNWETSGIAYSFMRYSPFFLVQAMVTGKDLSSLYRDTYAVIANAELMDDGGRYLGDVARHLVIKYVMGHRSGLKMPKEFGALLDINASEADVEHAVSSFTSKSKETTKKLKSGHSKIDPQVQADYAFISVFKDLVTGSAAEMWAVQGHDFEHIFKAARIRARIALAKSEFDMKEEIFESAFAAFMGYALAGFPEQWDRFSIKAHQFLGMNMLHYNEVVKCSGEHSNAAILYSLLAKSPIGRYANDDARNKLIFKSLEKAFPDLYAPAHALYDASRSKIWAKTVTNTESITDLLTTINLLGIWHPLCNRIEFVERAGAETKRKIVEDFLDNGSKWMQVLAEEALSSNLIDVDQMIRSLSKKKHFKNLALILSPTPEQAALIPQKYKSTFLKVQLGL